MGLRSFANKLGDGLEHGVDKVKKKAGEIIDDGAHIVGDGLEHVGLDDAADWVEDKGDSVADHLGAHVAEQQLGQTDDPKELLHGDAGKIRAAATHLTKFSKAFDTGHTGLTHLDPGDWDGAGAEAFRAKFKPQPAKWAKAATACQDAATALETYAHTVDWARGQATEAVRLWKQGVAKRKAAADAYNSTLDTYHDDVKAYNDKVDDGKDPGTKPVAPAAFTDPGAKDRQAAQHTLDAARKQRDTAASHAQTAITTATALAPAKPDFTGRMENDFGDVGKAAPIAGEHFLGGLVRSGTDLVKFARGLNPTDPYNMTHPAQYLTHLNATAAGLVDMTQHPERLPGIILGSGWGSDGSEAGGRLVGNILLAIATDGGSAAGKTVAEGAAKNAAKDAAEQAAKSGARAAAEDPVKAAIEKAAKKCVSDPVDIATGDTLLSQTDITLPGTLPLVLERTHLSSYRIGRLFGPSWASTLDQRLELDDQGVVFVNADGSLLIYPIPVAGSPVLPADGPRWPLEWDGTPGAPLRITDTDTGRTLHFAAADVPSAGGATVLALVEVTDRNDNGYTVTYRGGLPTAIQHCGGYSLRLDGDGGRITALRLLDPASPGGPGTLVRTYGYDTAGNLTEVADSEGVPYRFTYDAAGRVTSWTDRNTTPYGYTYDARGRCVATHGADGYLSSTLSYDDATRTTAFTNSLGHTWTYQHDEAYRLVAETDPLGHTTVREWDPGSRKPARITDPLGRATSYHYDSAGNIVSVVRAGGPSATAVHNDLKLPVEITDAGGGLWRHAYDARGNELSLTDPAGSTTRRAYDASGHVVAVEDALGNTRRVVNDAAGLPIAVTDPLGRTTTVERDAFGRVVTLTEPMGRVTRCGWTVEGKPTWRELPDGTRESWTWDAEGNLLTETNAAGLRTSHPPTHFDLPMSRTTPDGVTYHFTYDTELNLTAVTDAQGLSWDYTYDPAGRLTAEKDFNGRALSYGYDAAGQLVSRTNGAGETVTLVRDDLGRVVEQRAGDSASTFAYDSAGNLLRAVNADCEVVREYDVLGRLVGESVDGRTIAYGYDAEGRVVERRTPGGAVFSWSYDALGRPAGLAGAGGDFTFTYDAAGRETARAFGPGLTLNQGWDRTDRLTSHSITRADDAGAVLLQHREYAYRADGFVTEVRELTGAGGSRHFDLDPAGRVTAVRAHDWTERYAYDSLGNLVQAATPATEAGDVHHELRGTLTRRVGRTRYEHDAQGRVVRTTKRLLNGQVRVREFVWNAEDQLTASVMPDGTRWRYRYDAGGRRTAKQRIAPDGLVVEDVHFTWDGTRLAEQTDGSGRTTSWEYTPGTHRPVAQVERELDDLDSRFYAIVTDLVGSPTELFAADGELVWQQRSTLWGSRLTPAAAGGVDCPLRFPGQYADAETEWNYNYFRHYDPASAGYVTADPMGLGPAPNHHAYVDNPLTRSDPLGLYGCEPVGPLDHVALGRDMRGEINVKDFADKVGARHLMGNVTDWREQVVRAAGRVSRGEGKISFMLDGLPGANGGAAQALKRAIEDVQAGRHFATQWELVQMHEHGIMDKVDFYRWSRKINTWGLL
ncbi:putative T7SS-secreted protein [Streptomyces sp. NBC_01198]|uniref:putative T7SS-secreted protein n=1 Tax=Streptomyces sp. NBC_01198 TaxID=2903769 RepID=UPI002E13A398|nr:DUF6531 domain-containing protein [Streptomyces sp. NBC_01198]